MTSIQDIANAAHRIKEGAQDLGARAASCGQTLSQHNTRLAQVTRGSRSGEEAVQQVTVAQRTVQDAAVQLRALETAIDHFVNDLTK